MEVFQCDGGLPVAKLPLGTLFGAVGLAVAIPEMGGSYTVNVIGGAYAYNTHSHTTHKCTHTTHTTQATQSTHTRTYAPHVTHSLPLTDAPILSGLNGVPNTQNGQFIINPLSGIGTSLWLCVAVSTTNGIVGASCVCYVCSLRVYVYVCAHETSIVLFRSSAGVCVFTACLCVYAPQW